MLRAAKITAHCLTLRMMSGIARRTVSVATANVERITPIEAAERPMRAP